MTANSSHSYSDWCVSLCNMGYVIVIKIILYFIYYSTQGFQQIASYMESKTISVILNKLFTNMMSASDQLMNLTAV